MEKTNKELIEEVGGSEKVSIPGYRYKDNVMLDVLPAYMKNLPPLIAPEDEYDLITRAQNGDEEARKTFIMGNLRLVIYIAKKYNKASNSLALEDLIQEGNQGLMEALDKFDVNMGNKFSTYAIFWIKQAITKALSETGKAIKLPTDFNSIVNYVRRIENDMREEFGIYPTKQELFACVNKVRKEENKSEITQAKFDQILNELRVSTVSLNDLTGEMEETELGDFIGDPEADKSGEVINKIAEVEFINNIAGIITNNKIENNYDFFPNLEQELEVILLKFGILDGEPLKSSDISKIYGISDIRINQIEKKALRKLRNINNGSFSFGEDGMEIISNYVKENGIVPVDISHYSVEGIIKKYNHINKLILIDKNNIENIGGIILSDIENSNKDELKQCLEILIQSTEKVMGFMIPPAKIGIKYNLSEAAVTKIIGKLHNRLKVLLKDYIKEYKDIDKSIVNYCIINDIEPINLNDYQHLGVTMDKERQYLK